MHAIRRKLHHVYWKLQPLLVPGLRNAQYVYKETLERYVTPNTSWLDLGCGHQVLPEWMPASEKEQSTLVGRSGATFGIDGDFHSLRQNQFLTNLVVGDIHQLPFTSQCFDLITANMVIEHVADPGVLLAEVHRVLKPKGIFLFHTPNWWNYSTLVAALVPEWVKPTLVSFLDGRQEEDIFPTLYRMNTPKTIRSLSHRNRFILVQLNIVESSAQLVMLGPIVVLELLWIRMLRLPFAKQLRSNIIAVLQRMD